MFQNLFQNLFYNKDPIKFPNQYSKLVRIIPVFENSPEPAQAGENTARIWENYRNVKGNFHEQSVAAIQRFGTSGPLIVCGRCELPDRFFSEFIRNYWDCPNGD